MTPDFEKTVKMAGVASYPVVSRPSLATQRHLLAAWLALTDAIALGAACRVAYWIRFELQITLAPEVVARIEDYQWLAAVVMPLWLVVFALFSLYDRQSNLGGIQESSRIFNASTVATMLVIVGTFGTQRLAISRMWLVSLWVLSFLFVAVNRFVARRVVYAFRRRGYLLTPAVIVGTNEEAVSLASFLADRQASGVRTLGFVSSDDGEPLERHAGLPVLGSAREIQAIVEKHGIEDVIVAITALDREDLLRLYEDADPLPVHLRLSSGLYELLTTRVTVRTLGNVPLMSLQKNRLARGEVITKTVVESTLAVAGLIVLSPVLLAIAAWIKLDSSGPVIYRRRVLGVSGGQFDAFKFRTMHVNGSALLEQHAEAAEELRHNHKLKNDPRITPAGRVLRKYSLDELPQLFNVLLGQMALVGPRMISPEEAEKYGRQRMNLLTVKPGITGLWQVSGRSDLSYEERVRLDMYYVRNYSVWMDLQILFIQTVPAVLRSRGAY